jgi:CxxC motif-containing protein
MKKELICISCPIGCHLIVLQKGDDDIVVTGNKCPRGEIYGREELLAPKRVVTASVKSTSSHHPYVPVKTDKPLLREYIPSLLKKLYSISVKVPVHIGDILLRNIEGTDTNVIFTRTIEKTSKNADNSNDITSTD